MLSVLQGNPYPHVLCPSNRSSQPIVVEFTVHVSACENDADPLALVLGLFSNSRCQSCCTCALGQVMRVLVIDAHCFGDLCVGDFDDARDVVPDRLHCLLIRKPACTPVRNHCLRWSFAE